MKKMNRKKKKFKKRKKLDEIPLKKRNQKRGRCHTEKGRYWLNNKGKRRRDWRRGEKNTKIQKRGRNMVMAARLTEIESGE